MIKTTVLCFILALLVCNEVNAQHCIFSKSSSTKKCCSSDKQKKEKQEKSSQNFSKQAAWKPFVEPVFQFGLCGTGNPLGLIAGAEKNMSRHISVAADVQVWKTKYENWCCDVHSVGKYSTFIPSVKVKLDPGKPNKGFFVGVGIGYAIVSDKGTEEPYSYDPNGGMKTSGAPTTGDWSYKSISPSFQWGVGFKAFKLPMSIVNTTYWAKTTEGWMGVAVGTGLKVGLNKVAEKKSCGKSKSNSKCGGGGMRKCGN